MAKKIIVGWAMAMAIVAITLLIVTTNKGDEEALVSNEVEITSSKKNVIIPLSEKSTSEVAPLVRRASRFLVEEYLKPNPRAKYHCHKDYNVCYEEGSLGTTCCNNKCIGLKTDRNNCGSCKNKCKFTDECCNGECVNVWYDKRHCGKCFNKCMPGGYCIYGMCDYA